MGLGMVHVHSSRIQVRVEISLLCRWRRMAPQEWSLPIPFVTRNISTSLTFYKQPTPRNQHQTRGTRKVTWLNCWRPLVISISHYARFSGRATSSHLRVYQLNKKQYCNRSKDLRTTRFRSPPNIDTRSLNINRGCRPCKAKERTWVSRMPKVFDCSFQVRAAKTSMLFSKWPKAFACLEQRGF